MFSCVTNIHYLHYTRHRFPVHMGICKRLVSKSPALLNAILIACVQTKYLKCLKLTGNMVGIPSPPLAKIESKIHSQTM